jgi:hypothetical protein
MPQRSSTDLTSLDFDKVKQNLKDFLRSQDVFKDYDFESSNINVLLDVLAYNTNLNAFYLNMLASEMFLDTAQLRDSVISHAKELNYLPRSFRSAVADVDIIITPTNGSPASFVIPRGQTFTGTVDGRSFTFVTDQNINVGSENGVFRARNVSLFEGDFVFDSYVTNESSPSRYIITNKTVDTNSLTVVVTEDNGETVIQYRRADSLFGLDGQSPVFFIQPAENDTYEIVFGDGVIGRKPKDRSIVLIQYRKCNGELPNGIRVFSSDGDITGGRVSRIITNTPARGGSISESITSIKFNAPRAFTTQERVVTAGDYETLLKANFSEINAVSAFGGEEDVPPQFGKVIIAVDLKTTDQLPPSKRRIYRDFIKPRSPLSIDPVFVDPEFTFVRVNTRVKYNINQTSLNIDDIRTIVRSAIQEFNAENLNGFNKTLFYSNLVSTIDDSQQSIVSNDTEIFAQKIFVPAVGILANYDIDFGMALKDDIAQLSATRKNDELTIISSTPFIFNGTQCILEDDGEGNMRIMAGNIRGQEGFREIRTVGKVDYEKGFIQLNQFGPQALVDGQINIFARTFERNISSIRKTILAIRPRDINIEVEQVRI